MLRIVIEVNEGQVSVQSSPSGDAPSDAGVAEGGSAPASDTASDTPQMEDAGPPPSGLVEAINAAFQSSSADFGVLDGASASNEAAGSPASADTPASGSNDMNDVMDGGAGPTDSGSGSSNQN